MGASASQEATKEESVPIVLTPEQKIKAAPQLLVHQVVALSLDIKGGKLSAEQEQQLDAALAPVIQGPEPQLALAVACWLRDTRELGNRLLPIQILVRCARHESTREFIRTAAPKVLLIPGDITEAFGLSKQHGGPLPACLKKAGKDLLEKLSEFSAAKYDTRSKEKRLKAIIRKSQRDMAQVRGEEPIQAWPGFMGLIQGHVFKAAEGGKGRGLSEAQKETRLRSLQKRHDDALEKLKKLKSGSLPTLVRKCHASAPNELMVRILRKRYPESEESFARSGLSGEFQEERAEEPLRLDIPQTWERQLSKLGNVPSTWRDMLVQEPCPVGATALLRNLRNILQMGFSLSFLDKYVLKRIRSGAGQTPVTLAQTLQFIKKEFSDEELTNLYTSSVQHKENIMAYNRIRRWLTSGKSAVAANSSSGLGHFGATAERLISEFLGYPLTESVGLSLVNGCFLKIERAKVRGGMTEITRRRIVPFVPPSIQIIRAFEEAFLEGIQKASEAGIPVIPGERKALLWLDLTPPPLAKGAAALGLAEGETHLCGLKDFDVPAVPAGGQVPLEQILGSPLLNIELLYAARTFIDYNLHAYSREGKLLWSSTWCDTCPGREKRNAKGVFAVHCRDICSGTHEAPALRTLHVDLSNMDEEVFAICISSQCYCGTPPQAASVCIREIPEAQRARFNQLVGGHQPQEDFRGEPKLGASLTAALKAGANGVGGTCTYGMIYRDVRKGAGKWLFRNLMDMCLQSGTFVAVQINNVMKQIFTESVNAEAVLTCKDPDLPAYVRICQLAKAFEKGGGHARICATGISWATRKAAVKDFKLSGNILQDIASLMTVRQDFQDCHLPAGTAMLALAKASQERPDVLVRLGNVPCFPEQAAKDIGGESLQLVGLDLKGSIASREDLLGASKSVSWLPGLTEGTVRMVSAALRRTSEDDPCLTAYVRKFLPPKTSRLEEGASAAAAASSASGPEDPTEDEDGELEDLEDETEEE